MRHASTTESHRRPIMWRHTGALRRGVTTVESAFVLSVLFLVLFVLFDLGLAVFQYNTLSAVACRLARAAIVTCDQRRPPDQTSWGPNEYIGTAAEQFADRIGGGPVVGHDAEFRP